MKVVILCGGLGTRLREETEFRPKPMVDVGGRPILWHIMKHCDHHGHREFVLCLGYRGDTIKRYFLDYEEMNNDFTATLGRGHGVRLRGDHGEQGYEVTLAETGAATETGGRIARAAKYLDGGTFMVLYGDGVSDVDLGAALAFHRSHGKLATVTAVRPPSRFGIIDVRGDRAAGFAEKPTVEGWASAGYFLFEPPVLGYLDGDGCALERGPLARLAAEGELMVHRHEGFFFAMDTYREYKLLNELWDRGDAPWKVWG